MKYRDYATHGQLKLFYVSGRGLTHQTHKNPKERNKKRKGVATSLVRRPGRPARSGRIVAKWRTLRLVRSVLGPRADRLRTCTPLFIVDDSREGFADLRAEDERPTKRQQVKQAPDTEREKIHARAPDSKPERERKKKEWDRNHKKSFSIHPRAKRRGRRTGPSTRERQEA